MDMGYYIIRNKVRQSLRLCLMMTCSVFVSCAVGDSDTDALYHDATCDYETVIGSLGVYEGNWTLDSQNAGTGLMTVSKDSIIFDTLPQEAIIRRISNIQDITCEPVRYSVRYFLNGSSTDTYYFTLESKSYEYSIKVGDDLSPVYVKMSTLYSDLPNAIYNKGTMVSMLKISRIAIQTENGETVADDFKPALVLMFNPIKRIR